MFTNGRCPPDVLSHLAAESHKRERLCAPAVGCRDTIHRAETLLPVTRRAPRCLSQPRCQDCFQPRFAQKSRLQGFAPLSSPLQHAFIADDASLATPLGLVPLQGLPAPSLRARLLTAQLPANRAACCQASLAALCSAVSQRLAPLVLRPRCRRYRMPKPPFTTTPPQPRSSPESRTCLATAWRFARPIPERICPTPLSSTVRPLPPTEPGFLWLPRLPSLGSAFPPLPPTPERVRFHRVPTVPRIRCQLVCPTGAAARLPPPRGRSPAPTGALDTLSGPTNLPDRLHRFTTEVAPPLPLSPSCPLNTPDSRCPSTEPPVAWLPCFRSLQPVRLPNFLIRITLPGG